MRRRDRFMCHAIDVVAMVDGETTPLLVQPTLSDLVERRRLAIKKCHDLLAGAGGPNG